MTIDPAPRPVAPASELPANRGLSMADAIVTMRAALATFLVRPAAPPAPAPPASTPLPPNSVTIVSLRERPVGLGDRRGNETRASFAAVALLGGRLEAVVRFQLWGRQPGDVDEDVIDLQTRFLAARAALRAAGFLRIAEDVISLAEPVPALDGWRKTADFSVLYEFLFEGSEGARSLISRIPIDLVGETPDSTVVTDEMVRWDDRGAPDLELRGDRGLLTIRTLFGLSFLPDGWDGATVTIAARVGGIATARTFPSVRAFRDAFDTDPRPVTLEDDVYEGGSMALPEPVVLRDAADVFRVAYAASTFDSGAVVYLRALR
jgi:hypothetical protein